MLQWFQRLIGQTVRVSRLVKRWAAAAPLLKPFGRQLLPAGRSDVRLSEWNGSLQLCLSAAATTTSTTQGEAENDSGPAPGEGGGFFFGQKIVLDVRASGESQYEQSGHFWCQNFGPAVGMPSHFIVIFMAGTKCYITVTLSQKECLSLAPRKIKQFSSLSKFI